MPFWLAAAIFVACSSSLFEWRPGEPWAARARRHRRRRPAQGVVTGVAVTLVFEKVFYVRLP